MPSLARQLSRLHGEPTSEPVARMRHVALAAGRLGQHVGALGAQVLVAPAAQHRHRLAGQRQDRGRRTRACSASSQHSAVSTASAGRNTLRLGMARSAARCSTGWCVGPSSPSPIEVVRHHVDDALAHERREADRGPAVVGEDQERAAVGHDAAVQRHAVHGRRHGVLAHAVVDVVAAEVAGRDGGVVLGARAVGAGEIGRAADQAGQRRDELLQHLLRGDAGGDLRRRGGELGLDLGRPPRPPPRAPPHPWDRRAAPACARRAWPRAAPRPCAARAPRAPAARQAASTSAGTSKAACAQPSFSRAPLISSAPSGSPWVEALPCLVGAP